MMPDAGWSSPNHPSMSTHVEVIISWDVWSYHSFDVKENSPCNPLRNQYIEENLFSFYCVVLFLIILCLLNGVD